MYLNGESPEYRRALHKLPWKLFENSNKSAEADKFNSVGRIPTCAAKKHLLGMFG